MTGPCRTGGGDARTQPPRRDAERNPYDGRLSPWADAAADAPGWQITSPSRRLTAALAATVSGGTVHSDKKGEWQARIPQPVLTVVVTGADSGALRCRLRTEPHDGVFALAIAPWPVTTVLKCPLSALPAQGQPRAGGL